jgi:hypothetical protein
MTATVLDFERPVAPPADARVDLLSLDEAGLAALIASLGERTFRAGQIFA